jgi:hypothetical protein
MTSQMPQQSQPLPVAVKFTVSFEAELRETSDKPRRTWKSREFEEFEAATLSTNPRTYRVYLINQSGLKQTSQFLTIRYAFQ